MIKFQLKYFLLTLLIFAAEVFIGMYMHDAYIRPYGGDFLVVILIYCFVKSFSNYPVNITAISTLLFAYAVEVSQYFHLVYVLGWGNSTFAKIIMGTSFAWTDMLMYTLGILLVIIIEKCSKHNKWQIL